MKSLTKKQMTKIENAIRNIIIALGDDPNREGLIETPSRVARMYNEVFEGMRYTNEDIAHMFDKCFDAPGVRDLVLVKDIETFSYCEHHLALMYNMNISVAYIPNGRVIGLSKIARIADMVCKRLQLQERIGKDIADILKMILHTENIMVCISGEHSCMTARGVKKPGTVTKTAVVRGQFESDSTLRQEVYDLLK